MKSDKQEEGIFKHTALGGTFDRLHKGHRRFLNKAFSISEEVSVGITDDKFAFMIHQDSRLEPFSTRQNQVQNYLKDQGFGSRAQLIELSDPFGPTIKDKSLEALVVTSKTLQNGHELNRHRQKNGLSPVKIITQPIIRAADRKGISSQRIRKGEIDREGVVFFQQLRDSTPISLPIRLRSAFREPFGKIFPSVGRNIYQSMQNVADYAEDRDLSPLIAVGDLVTHSLLKLDESPRISIADFKVQRKKRFSTISDIGPLDHLQAAEVKNPPGIITKKLSKLVHQALNLDSSSVILVDGEEDLAALPCMLLAPLDAAVIYGHFQHGIIVVEITEEKKHQALRLLQELKRVTQTQADA